MERSLMNDVSPLTEETAEASSPVLPEAFPASLRRNRDLGISRRVTERLNWDKRVSTLDVYVHVNNGRVTLVGKVDAQEKKEAAAEIAQNTKGVKAVENLLEVPKNFVRDDFELRRLIKQKLGELSLLGGEYVAVDVKRGCVKLEGFVSHASKKFMAGALASELSGVEDLFNLITVDSSLNLRNTDEARAFLPGAVPT